MHNFLARFNLNNKTSNICSEIKLMLLANELSLSLWHFAMRLGPRTYSAAALWLPVIASRTRLSSQLRTYSLWAHSVPVRIALHSLCIHAFIHSFVRSFVRSFMTHCQLATFNRANGLSPWLTLPHELQLSVHICFYDVFMRLFRIHGVTLSLTVCGSFPRRYYRLTDGRLNDIPWLLWSQFYCTLTALSGSLSSIIAKDAIW